MGYLYEDGAPSGPFLYDGEDVPPVTEGLLRRDLVVVVPMRRAVTPYGERLEEAGDPVWCRCCFEWRTNKTSTFSKNWAQDTTPQTHGGLREDALAFLLAPEWHGDVNTRFWHGPDCFEVDGPPMFQPHSTRAARHWSITARCVGHADKVGQSPPVPAEGAPTWGG